MDHSETYPLTHQSVNTLGQLDHFDDRKFFQELPTSRWKSLGQGTVNEGFSFGHFNPGRNMYYSGVAKNKLLLIPCHDRWRVNAVDMWRCIPDVAHVIKSATWWG
jgi:hypothetical protein